MKAGVPIAVGTGAGNLLVFPGASVHRELELLVKAGLSPMDAIVAATRKTAESIGRGAEVGTIETGKAARPSYSERRSAGGHPEHAED